MSQTSQADVFQLSAVSQNDVGAADGKAICCTITKICNGTLRQGSSPVGTPVLLPIPSNASPHPLTPTWLLAPSGPLDTSGFTLEISCPADAGYPKANIEFSAKDVMAWAQHNDSHPTTQVYQTGAYGIVGYAQNGHQGPIYTVTAGVLDPTPDHTRPMTLTVSGSPASGYTGVFDPNITTFHAHRSLRAIICTLVTSAEVPPNSQFVSAAYSIPNCMTAVIASDGKSIMLAFNFHDQKETGNLSFVVNIDGKQHTFDPQVGNDPPPQNP